MESNELLAAAKVFIDSADPVRLVELIEPHAKQLAVIDSSEAEELRYRYLEGLLFLNRTSSFFKYYSAVKESITRRSPRALAFLSLWMQAKIEIFEPAKLTLPVAALSVRENRQLFSEILLLNGKSLFLRGRLFLIAKLAIGASALFRGRSAVPAQYRKIYLNIGWSGKLTKKITVSNFVKQKPSRQSPAMAPTAISGYDFSQDHKDSLIKKTAASLEAGDAEQTRKLLAALKKLGGYPWGEITLFKRAEGVKENNVAGFFDTYSHAGTTLALSHNVRNFHTDIQDLQHSQILILGQYGPGDELMATTTYESIIDWASANGNHITVATQQRIIDLIASTYPEIKFLACNRLNQGIIAHSIENARLLHSYELTPTNRLSMVVTRDIYHTLGNYDAVTTSTMVLPRFHSGKPCRKLLLDPNLVKRWQSTLAALRSNGNRLVGLSWRSLLLQNRRNSYYFKAEDLAPLAQVANATFINLQPHIDQSEIDVLAKLGINFVSFEDLDLIDDLSSMAALVSELDAVVSVVTTNSELAAISGKNTLILCPTPDLAWRQTAPDSNQDVVHGNIRVQLLFPDSFDNRYSCIDKSADILGKL